MSTTATPSTASSPAGSMAAIRTIAADIKLAHSVFALPFALLAAVMAAGPAGSAIDWRRFAGQAVLIVLAMVFARTVAMLANRLLDADIDARNPRTAGRAIPSGRLSKRAVSTAILTCGVAFMLVCVGFGLLFANWWPAALGVPVLLWISGYGLFKRYTSWCHVYLGSSLAISPIAAALAVDPVALTSQPAIWLLSGMVLCWVAGFDVIYALQDVDVDRRDGLHSVPSRLGVRRGLLVSRGLHVVASALLIGAAFIDPRFGVAFTVGVVLVIGLLVTEHATVARWGTTRIALTFFTLNGVISCVLGGLGMLDIIIGVA